ncbi:hypothetical protein PENSPDRAFT_681487 [Peniophora sp. CONT]|nr:hypothetical protein PENSPDRAFT_681487 [Peniophora sp. CONT]
MAACLPIVGLIGTVILVEYDDDDDGSFRALATVSRQRKAARAALAMPASGAPHSRVFAPISPNGTPYAPDELFCAGSAPAKPDVRRYVSNDDGRTALMFTDGVLFEPTSRRDDPLSAAGIRTRNTRRPSRSCRVSVQAQTMAARGIHFDARSSRLYAKLCILRSGADRVDEWARKGWKKTNGRVVQDEDLWRIFLQRASDLEKDGVRVAIWRVRHSTSAGETDRKR